MYGFVWRRCCNTKHYYKLLGQCQSRRFSAVINNVVSDQHQPNSSVLVEGKYGSRIAILNRPSVLNALDTSMLVRLQKLYQSWEDDPDIGFVTLKGRGRAFCAGGDVVGFYHSISIGDLGAIKEFFWNINNLIYLINTYMKPHVALLNGITMGGGAGISIPGTFRVATDKTVFATPEALIGYHPDAGASFYLSHLSGYLGALAEESIIFEIHAFSLGCAKTYISGSRLRASVCFHIVMDGSKPIILVDILLNGAYTDLGAYKRRPNSG